MVVQDTSHANVQLRLTRHVTSGTRKDILQKCVVLMPETEVESPIVNTGEDSKWKRSILYKVSDTDDENAYVLSNNDEQNSAEMAYQ